MAGVRYVGRSTLADCTRAWLAAVAPYARGRPVPPLDRSALLLVDLQRYFAEAESHACLPALDAVLPGLLRLARAWFAAGRPLVLTRHGQVADGPFTPMRAWWNDAVRRGEPRARLVQELEQLAEELRREDPRRVLVLDKTHYSAFVETELADWLRGHGCDTVVIGGVMTHLCCETTARDAFMRGLSVVMLADGCASMDEELHLGALRGLAHGFAVVCSTGCARQELADPGGAVASWDRRQRPTLPDAAELVVVGAGPAGLIAAVQARRLGLEPLLLDPGPVGGLSSTAQRMENVVGFPGGITGHALVERLRAQGARWQLTPVRVEVTGIQEINNKIQVFIHNGRAVEARAVILASGTVARELPLARMSHPRIVTRVDALPRRGIRRVLVVGGGEAALDQCMLCQDRGVQTVQLAVRGARARAMDLLLRRAEDRGVTFLFNTRVADVEPEGEGLSLALDRPDGRQTCLVDALVVCIGRAPRLPRLPERLSLDRDGVPAVDRLGRTDLPGLYLAGDVCRGITRQVAVAAGDGLAAAMHAARYLGGKPWRTDDGS